MRQNTVQKVAVCYDNRSDSPLSLTGVIFALTIVSAALFIIILQIQGSLIKFLIAFTNI